jgi:hypothetical protein
MALDSSCPSCVFLPSFSLVADILAMWTSSTYLLRAIFGPKMDPQSLFVLFVLRPFAEDKLGLIKSEFRNDSSPRRYAMIMGSSVGWIGTILLLLSTRMPCAHQACMKAAGLVLLGFLALIMQVQYRINEFESKFEFSTVSDDSYIVKPLEVTTNPANSCPTSLASISKQNSDECFKIKTKKRRVCCMSIVCTKKKVGWPEP